MDKTSAGEDILLTGDGQNIEKYTQCWTSHLDLKPKRLRACRGPNGRTLLLLRTNHRKMYSVLDVTSRWNAEKVVW